MCQKRQPQPSASECHQWTFVLTECDHFYIMLRPVFEGIFFTENNITIETDELEGEKRAKIPLKMKSSSIEGASKILQEFGGSHPKLNRETKARAVAYSITRNECSVS